MIRVGGGRVLPRFLLPEEGLAAGVFLYAGVRDGDAEELWAEIDDHGWPGCSTEGCPYPATHVLLGRTDLGELMLLTGCAEGHGSIVLEIFEEANPGALPQG